MSEFRMPSLNALRSFEAVGRHLSFLKAAEELCVTQSAVSHLVKQLEADIGVTLFKRHSKGVSLTPAGAAYLPSLTEAFANILAATRLVSRKRQNNRLAVTLLPTMAMHWLMPRLPYFYEQHPSLRVDISVGDRMVDFTEEPVDIAILKGLGHWQGMEADLLMRENVILIASPKLLKAKPIKTAKDILNHTLLTHARRPSAWKEWFTATKLDIRKVNSGPSFEHLFMSIEAVQKEMGIALVPDFLVKDLLEQKKLIAPLSIKIKSKEAYYIVYKAGRGYELKIRKFCDWIKKQAL